MVDFGALGLASDSGFDTGRWLLLSPGLFLGIYLLLASPTMTRWVLRGPLFVMMMWFGWAFASAAWSVDAKSTILQTTLAVTVFVSSFWFVRSYGRVNFARVFCVSAGLVLAVGLANDLIPAVAEILPIAVSQTEFGIETGRSPGITPGVNQLGMLAGVTMMMLIRMSPRTRMGRVFQFAVGAIAVMSMLTAGSRSVAVCTVVAIAVQLGLDSSVQVRIRGFVGAAAAGLAVVGFVGTSGRETTFEAGRSFDSLNGREDVWDYAFELIAAKPLQGYGMMTGSETWNRAFSLRRTTFDAGDAHNSVLELLIGTGSIGLALFGSGCAWAVMRAWRSRDADALALLLLVGFVGLTEALISAPGLAYSILGVSLAMVAVDNASRPWPNGRGGKPSLLLGETAEPELVGASR